MKIKHLFWMALIMMAMPLDAQTEPGIFAPFVSRLTAKPENHFIHLSWTDSQDIRGPVYIYRSTTPFSGQNPILGNVLAVIPYGFGSYTDEIAGGGNFYYFVVASDEGGRRFDFPIAYANTKNVWSVMEIAPTPTPEYLPVRLMNPRVFARDLEYFSASSEEYILASIVRGSFATRNWEAAKYELISFLAYPRSPETGARARFYLGQCLYFLHEPQQGLFEFLTIQDRFPEEIAKWIQAVQNMINQNITF